MRKATWKDQKLVSDILVKAFLESPGVNWMFKPSVDPVLCLQRMARYVLVKTINRDGAWIASNEKGLIFFFEASRSPFSLRELWYEFYFAVTCIGIRRIPAVLHRESIRKSLRPADRKYLYCWFLAVLKEGRGAAYELKDFLFSESVRRNLPVYVETSSLRTRIVYERIGFTTYHEWKDEKAGIHLWFMKWDPREKVHQEITPDS